MIGLQETVGDSDLHVLLVRLVTFSVQMSALCLTLSPRVCGMVVSVWVDEVGICSMWRK